MKIRAILVDDQPTGLAVLRDMLHHSEPDIEIIGMAASGREAVESINQLAPDLVFLDVQMPEVDGFEVVAQIKLPRMPIIIFVTGRDDLALKAFEAHALDYLVKPCKLDRLKSAVQRARQQIQSNQNGDIQEKLDGLLDDLKAVSKYPERLAVKSNGRIVFLRLTDIDLVESADNYVKLIRRQGNAHASRNHDRAGGKTSPGPFRAHQPLDHREHRIGQGIASHVSRRIHGLAAQRHARDAHPGLSGTTPATGRDALSLTC